MPQTINIELLQLLEDKLGKEEGRKVHHPVFTVIFLNQNVLEFIFRVLGVIK